MSPLVATHVVAGSVALLAGFVAMGARKGGTTHRAAGQGFVVAMIVMGLLGATMAARIPERASVAGGLLAAYLVATAMLAVRRDVAHPRRWLAACMALALLVGATTLALDVVALGEPRGSLDGMPAGMYFVFGAIALLAGLSDAHVLLAGPRVGAARLSRHVWRMGFAMFIATGSFFLGQADEFPVALRIPVVMFPPVLLVIGHTLYWLVKLRVQRRNPAALPRRPTARVADDRAAFARSPSP